MLPDSTARRRTHAELEDDNDSGSSATSRDSDTPKRRRMNSHINGNTVNSSAYQGLHNFNPGAILRVTVENFVTYEKAEFFPGPNLNMVIGPNGTGKSSLVCAICLGLGYGPKHLGRGGSVKDFVKNGKDIATIEIELQKRLQDRSNFVVRVQIRREQNNQKWWLNGKEASHKAIQNLMTTLKIQVDNLCQFLPQDRVVEFAASTPVDLLRETLRAAAPEDMLEWQKQLRELHKDKKELGEAVNTDTETLRNLENRQQGLQADVDRIREREEIEASVKNLKAALKLSRYNEAVARYEAAKARKREAARSLKRFEDEAGPSLQAVNEKQQYAQHVEAVIPGKLELLKAAERESQRLAKDVNAASDNVGEFQGRIDAERTGFDIKKKELAASRQKLTSLKADEKNKPPEFNSAEWNQRIRAEEHIQRDLEADKRQLDNRIGELKTRGAAKNEEIRRLAEDIESFNTQQGQQLALMKRHFPELVRGWEWIQENQSEFEKEVFGPPMVSCSIKDERYSDQVQALLQQDDFVCFTAQTKNDYKKLSNQLYKVMSLSVVIRTCANSLESFRPPVSREEATGMGLDGFAIDYLDGPEPVLAMFCSERGLHRSGVSLNEHNDAQFDSLVNSVTISQWAAGRQSYMVRRRKEYGPQAMTTITRNIQQGRFWTSQPVDTQELADLKQRHSESVDEKTQMKAEYSALQAEKSTLNEKITEIIEKIDQLKREKSQLQKEFHRWQTIPGRIENEEQHLLRVSNDMKTVKKTIVDLQYEWDAAALSRAKITLRHAASLEKIEQAHQELLEVKIQLIEAESDIDGLKLRNAGIMERRKDEKRKVDAAQEEQTEANRSGRELGQQVQAMLGDGDDEYRQVIRALSDGKTPDEVRNEAEAEEAKLELIHAANPNVMREFERRAGEIDKLKKTMDGSTQKLTKLTQETEELMAKWEPELDKLVSKINDAFAYNFEQISCAGEVRVHKDDDFDLWAIEIMVKFRENEALQQLNAHRQSGGERAVSTIFYLMALQSMAQSPFRVVDEINQGMDPRNERMVHERMVEIACREHTSQYFLITPKLLTGLRYDPKMRVLCIASGEHMPSDGGRLDFKKCLKIQRGLMLQA